MGSMLEARRAGMYVASVATRKIAISTMTYVLGSLV